MLDLIDRHYRKFRFLLIIIACLATLAMVELTYDERTGCPNMWEPDMEEHCIIKSKVG